MLKLIKYEFRKQVFTKCVILAFVALLEIVFFAGILLDKENVIGLAIGFLIMLATGAMFFVAYESILTFSNDLKHKCSYMLFLTPNTSYTIVGAKVITAALQVLVVGLAFLLIGTGDIGILVAKYHRIEELKDFISAAIEQIFHLNISFSDVFVVSVYSLISWINVITLAFFSITLSTTFLANKKYKGILSLAIFIALNVAFHYIMKFTIGTDTNTYTQSYYILRTLYYLCFTVITYLGTAFMLEKKVSV